jgi:hypothetical protein
MNEVKTKETPEVKQPEAQKYKEIKPQGDMSVTEAKQYWDNQFKEPLPEGGYIDDRKADDKPIYGEQGAETPSDAHQHWDKVFTQDHNEVGKEGGSYSEVKKNSDGQTHEVHHMPADSASHLDRTDGPAIKMEKEDHRQTASCGSSLEAREYQAEQREKKYWQNVDYGEAINSEIRKKYTESEEFAILRQKEEKPQEYIEYYEYCERCKAFVKKQIEKYANNN